MSVAVNNDVHNIPELVNKETAVKLRNNLNSQWMRKAFYETRKHGGALCASSVIDHVTGSRNEISSRYRFDVC